MVAPVAAVVMRAPDQVDVPWTWNICEGETVPMPNLPSVVMPRRSEPPRQRRATLPAEYQTQSSAALSEPRLRKLKPAEAPDERTVLPWTWSLPSGAPVPTPTLPLLVVLMLPLASG